MKVVDINNVKYELIKEYKDCFKLNEVLELVTDYFDEFDYIFGDYAYDKLRLKGFCDNNNSKCNKINDIKILENHIKKYCAQDAKYFLLKKVKK